MFDFYGTVVDMQGGLIEAITPTSSRRTTPRSPQAGW
jgi:hypothetical protein